MRGESATRRSGPRELSFVTGELSVEFEVNPDAIRGQLVPPTPGMVQVRDSTGAVRAFPVDDLGWFVIAPVPGGLIRLHVRAGSGAALLTDWFSL